MKTEEVKEPLQEAPAEPVEDEVDEDLDNDPEDEPEGADGQEDAAADTQEAEDDVDDDDLWDDWDDDDGADADDGSDAPESEPEPDAATEEEEADPAHSDEPEAPADPDANAELIDRLLTDLGYEGTAEEKVAKYKADNGISEPKPEEPAQEEADLDTRAKRDLETLTKAYPERMKGVKALKDIPEFDAVVRKMIASGCSMLEAYNDVVIGKVPSAKAEKQKAQAQSKSHLVGTSTAVRSSRFEPDASELRELRRNFPDYSESRIRELYRKVQKNTR
nr:MAG TPA: hypothetical protein [Caudoviricetes sp.]